MISESISMDAQNRMPVLLKFLSSFLFIPPILPPNRIHRHCHWLFQQIKKTDNAQLFFEFPKNFLIDKFWHDLIQNRCNPDIFKARFFIFHHAWLVALHCLHWADWASADFSSHWTGFLCMIVNSFGWISLRYARHVLKNHEIIWYSWADSLYVTVIDTIVSLIMISYKLSPCYGVHNCHHAIESTTVITLLNPKLSPCYWMYESYHATQSTRL